MEEDMYTYIQDVYTMDWRQEDGRNGRKCVYILTIHMVPELGANSSLTLTVFFFKLGSDTFVNPYNIAP